MQKPHWVV